jgi:hypothetical protein
MHKCTCDSVEEVGRDALAAVSGRDEKAWDAEGRREWSGMAEEGG